MAVTFDARFHKGQATGASPFSFVSNAGTTTGTVGSNANRVLIVAALFRSVAATVGTVTITWNGVALTQIQALTDLSTDGCAGLWGLIAPATGNQTLQVSWTGSHALVTVLGAVSLFNADQSTGWNNAGTDNGTGTTALSTVTTTNGSMAVAAHMNNNASSTVIGSGTSAWIETGLDLNYAQGYQAATTTSTDISWTLGNSQLWRNVKANILEATAGAPTPSVNDAVTVTEVQTLGIPMLPNIFNAVAIAELVGLAIPLLPRPFEAVTLAESVTVALTLLPVYRQSAVAKGGAVTLPLAVAAGDLIAVFVRWGSATIPLSGLTDTLGNTYVAVDNPITVASGARAATFYAKNVTGGVCTITADFGVSTPATIWMGAHEVVGRDLADPLDGHAAQAQLAPGLAADALTSTSFTPTRDGAYVFGGTSDAGLNSLTTPGSGFTGRLNDLPDQEVGFRTEDLIQVTAGAIAATFTPNQSVPYMTAGMAFKAATFLAINVNEAVTVSELASLGAAALITVADAVTVSEAVTIQELPILLNLSENVAVTESTPLALASGALNISVFDLVTLVPLDLRSIFVVDTVIVSELVIPVLSGVQVADTVTLAESVTVRLSVYIKVFDEVMLTLMPLQGDDITVTDAAAVAFNTQGARAAAANDTVVVTDGLTLTFSRLPFNLFDAIAVSELATVLLATIPISQSEAVTVSDVPTALLAARQTIAAEDVAVTESVSLVFSTGQRIISVSESVVITEAVTFAGLNNAIAFEAISVTESVTLAVGALALSVNDSVTVTDVVTTPSVDLQPILAETITVTDVATGALSFLRIQAGDDVTVADPISFLLNPIQITANETVTVDDPGLVLVGERQPEPKMRGMFAWERWARRGNS